MVEGREAWARVASADKNLADERTASSGLSKPKNPPEGGLSLRVGMRR